MTRKFRRKIEDFVCENCEQEVVGNGYTNHCPACLWSKHVDVQPGDRAEECSGMMEPVGIDGKSWEYRLLHRCEKCGVEKWNNAVKEDNFEALLQIVAQRGTG